MYRLTGFQRDLLFVLTSLDEPSGQEVKAELERSQERDVRHARLYANLDRLVERGLVEKTYSGGRTNWYATTADGRRAVESRFEWEESYLSPSTP